MSSRYDRLDHYLDRMDREVQGLEKENKNKQRPAGLKLQVQQPRLVVKADAFQDKNVGESKKGCSPDGRLEDISSVQVEDDPRGWTSFGE